MKEEAVFSHWNQTKGVHRHHKLHEHAEAIIKKTLKSYTVSEIQGAISNYSFILTSKKYKLIYRWTLSEFLTRKRGPCKDDPKQLWRFLEDEFDVDKFALADKVAEPAERVCKYCGKPTVASYGRNWHCGRAECRAKAQE